MPKIDGANMTRTATATDTRSFRSQNASTEPAAKVADPTHRISRSISAADPLQAAAGRLLPMADAAATIGSNALKGMRSADIAPHRYESRSIEPVNSHSGKANSSVAVIFDKSAGKIDKATGQPRGAYAIRFDQPHVGPGGKPLGYHLNFGSFPRIRTSKFMELS